MMKKLIVYDLDGTLVDTRKDIVLSVNYMLGQMGFEALEDEEIESYVGSGLRELMRLSLKVTDPKQLDKGGEIFRKFYAAHMLDHSVLYPGALETLQFFKNRHQAVLTNKPSPLSEQMLEKLKVADFMHEIVAGGPGKRHKPDPATFFEIMKKAGVLPEETLFIGDSKIDWETGRRAEVQTVLMTHGFTSQDELESLNPDLLVHSFKELLEVISQRNW